MSAAKTFSLQTSRRKLIKSAEAAAVGAVAAPLLSQGLYIEGLNHPKRMFDLAEGLIRRTYTDSAMELIPGGNFKRTVTAIWTV
jgi:microsomal dipeptidase-like Zn-dependent dipeptidase